MHAEEWKGCDRTVWPLLLVDALLHIKILHIKILLSCRVPQASGSITVYSTTVYMKGLRLQFSFCKTFISIKT